MLGVRSCFRSFIDGDARVQEGLREESNPGRLLPITRERFHTALHAIEQFAVRRPTVRM